MLFLVLLGYTFIIRPYRKAKLVSLCGATPHVSQNFDEKAHHIMEDDDAESGDDSEEEETAEVDWSRHADSQERKSIVEKWAEIKSMATVRNSCCGLL